MSAENLVDNFYQLHVSEDSTLFNKIAFLKEAGFPSGEKTLDDVTSTDDRIQIQAVVDFKENSSIDFTYALDPNDTQHTLLQTAFDANNELHFRFIFVENSGLSREFTGLLSKLTPLTDDPRQKTRMEGTIVITCEPTAVVGG